MMVSNTDQVLNILGRFMREDKTLPSVHVEPVGELLVFTDKAATGQA